MLGRGPGACQQLELESCGCTEVAGVAGTEPARTTGNHTYHRNKRFSIIVEEELLRWGTASITVSMSLTWLSVCKCADSGLTDQGYWLGWARCNILIAAAADIIPVLTITTYYHLSRLTLTSGHQSVGITLALRLGTKITVCFITQLHSLGVGVMFLFWTLIWLIYQSQALSLNPTMPHPLRFYPRESCYKIFLRLLTDIFPGTATPPCWSWTTRGTWAATTWRARAAPSRSPSGSTGRATKWS